MPTLEASERAASIVAAERLPATQPAPRARCRTASRAARMLPPHLFVCRSVGVFEVQFKLARWVYYAKYKSRACALLAGKGDVIDGARGTLVREGPPRYTRPFPHPPTYLPVLSTHLSRPRPRSHPHLLLSVALHGRSSTLVLPSANGSLRLATPPWPRPRTNSRPPRLSSPTATARAPCCPP